MNFSDLSRLGRVCTADLVTVGVSSPSPFSSSRARVELVLATRARGPVYSMPPGPVPPTACSCPSSSRQRPPPPAPPGMYLRFLFGGSVAASILGAMGRGRPGVREERGEAPTAAISAVGGGDVEGDAWVLDAATVVLWGRGGEGCGLRAAPGRVRSGAWQLHVMASA